MWASPEAKCLNGAVSGDGAIGTNLREMSGNCQQRESAARGG